MLADLIFSQTYREPFCENYSKCLADAAAPGGTNHLDCKNCPDAQVKPIEELSEYQQEHPNACYALFMVVFGMFEKKSRRDGEQSRRNLGNTSGNSEKALPWQVFKGQLGAGSPDFDGFM